MRYGDNQQVTEVDIRLSKQNSHRRKTDHAENQQIIKQLRL